MPFNLEEQYITAAEAALNVQFPPKFKAKMMQSNGGEVVEKTEGEEAYYHQLYPFFDQADNKRIARTCNHIGLETQNARQWRNFPKNAIAIGSDGCGNQLVLIHNGNGLLSENIYFWDHETGALEEIAAVISDLDSQ